MKTGSFLDSAYPMESAARDGTYFLAWSPGNPRAICRRARKAYFVVDNFRPKYSTDRFFNEFPEAPYTHWWPMPASPEDTIQ